MSHSLIQCDEVWHTINPPPPSYRTPLIHHLLARSLQDVHEVATLAFWVNSTWKHLNL